MTKKLALHWYLPTHGDGRTLTQAGAAPHGLYQGSRSVGATDEQIKAVGGVKVPVPAGARVASLDYMTQVAKAAESSGFDAVLTPTGTWCEESWVMAPALIPQTETLRFLLAFRPGTIAPSLAAQQAATFQRLSGGRLMLNIVTGADEGEMRRFGDGLDKPSRYARTDEFLTILKGAWTGEPFDFEGEHLWAEGALAAGVNLPPELYFGGSSEPALGVAAKHVDVYLSWADVPPEMGRHFERVGNMAADLGRNLRYGIRMHVIARPTAEEAWAAADRLISDADPAAIAAVQESLSNSEAVGQRRMAELNKGSLDDLEIYPNIWAGIGLLRPGAGTAIVGSYEEVADQIEEYADHGIGEFILSGYPHLEEAIWFGEGVMPILKERGVLSERNGLNLPDGVAVAS